MPEAKPGQLQQAPALLLAAPMQRPDSHMLAESTLSTPPTPDSTLFRGISNIEVLQVAASHPGVSWTSWLFKSSLQKGLALRASSWCLSAVKDLFFGSFYP